MTDVDVPVRVNGVSRTQLIDPGMSLLDLLRERLGLTPGEICERMSGNLCRCGAYLNIVRAITAVAGP